MAGACAAAVRPARLLAVCLTLLAAAAPTARAQKAADTLRVAWHDPVSDLDPYYNSERNGLVLAQQAWDTLVYRDPETFQIKPLLALSWRNVDDTTIEFELRPDVRFHDGSPFTADDVVYTVNTVIADPDVAVPGNYAYLAGADKVDDLHVRIRLKRVFPAALEYMALTLPIWPKAYRERVGAAAYARAPVGTGPYRITRVDGNSEIDLDRNDGYFDGPKGHPPIAHLVIQEVADVAAQAAALENGRADWIWMYGPDQANALDRDPDVVTMRADSMRVAYLSLDAAGRSGAAPLTDLRVRQAILHAIDRQALAGRLVRGSARMLDAPCYPTQFGCDGTAGTHYDYDPKAARALLAAAGYPDGFETELVSATLPQYATALRSDLLAVGIRVRVVQLSVDEAAQRVAAGNAPMLVGSWGSYSINDVSAFLPQFFGGGPQDQARDPELERLVAAGGDTTDPDQRRRAYSEAIRRITGQAYWLPLGTIATRYAFSRQLDFKPYPDELPRFYATRWR